MFLSRNMSKKTCVEHLQQGRPSFPGHNLAEREGRLSSPVQATEATTLLLSFTLFLACLEESSTVARSKLFLSAEPAGLPPFPDVATVYLPCLRVPGPRGDAC